jgi:uncharacterized membrane protein
MTVTKKATIEIKLAVIGKYDDNEQLKVTSEFKGVLFLFIYKLFSNASMLLLTERIMIFSGGCLVHRLAK